VPADGTPPQGLRDQLLKVHGVTIYVPVSLPRPLSAMIRIRTWTRTYQHEDLHASLTALQNALASAQQERLAAY
jgi:1,6-anhydro-N-acetylmuramate kinase